LPVHCPPTPDCRTLLPLFIFCYLPSLPRGNDFRVSSEKCL
jgi:hypothetical protein